MRFWRRREPARSQHSGCAMQPMVAPLRYAYRVRQQAKGTVGSEAVREQKAPSLRSAAHRLTQKGFTKTSIPHAP